jgi:hypothetical protein
MAGRVSSGRVAEVRAKLRAVLGKPLPGKSMGILAGKLFFASGVPPKPGHPNPPQPIGGTVNVFRANTLVRSRTVKKGQRFRFRLPAGDYLLRTPMGCDTPAHVDAGATTTTNVICAGK